jgi:hypothetical protein
MPLCNEHFLGAAERPRTLYEYFVTGSGQFPFDMLRFDECWPADSVSANAMAPDWASGKRSVKMRGYKEPTIGRWNSFTWAVSREAMVA